jgi:transposase InsO family protein
LHFDRCGQYCSHDYQAMIKQFGMNASMSRKEDCYDNGPMESFWGAIEKMNLSITAVLLGVKRHARQSPKPDEPEPNR